MGVLLGFRAVDRSASTSSFPPEARAGPDPCDNVGDRMTVSRGPALEQRRLGRTDIVASVLGFGGSEIGYQGVTGRTVARLLVSAIDAGLNVIDTAECYEDSESLIGKAIGARRREVHLFTKCGHAGGWARADWRPAPLPTRIERTLPPPAAAYPDLNQLPTLSP